VPVKLPHRRCMFCKQTTNRGYETGTSAWTRAGTRRRSDVAHFLEHQDPAAAPSGVSFRQSGLVRRRLRERAFVPPTERSSDRAHSRASADRDHQHGRILGAEEARHVVVIESRGRCTPTADGRPAERLSPWATWLVVHPWYLIGFQNRLLVLIRSSFSFATHGRGARLITGASTNSEQHDG
jgi:hypothetical protein